MEDNLRVGYKNPPEESKFKKGGSGNPKGRPKGSKTGISKLITKELNSKVTLSDGSKISKEECIVKDIVNEAVKGSEKKQRLLFNVKNQLEGKDVFELFGKRLIDKDYITPENLKAFAHKHDNLFLNDKRDIISDVYRHIFIKNITAYTSVIWMGSLALIHHELITSVRLYVLMRETMQEYYFWEGVDNTLALAKISEKERKSIISKLEKGRKDKRPPKELYYLVKSTYENTVNHPFQLIYAIRDCIKGGDFYDKNKELFFSNETKNYLLSKADKKDVDSLKVEMQIGEEIYKEFMKTKNDFHFTMNEDFNPLDPAVLEKLIKWLKGE